jgi:transcription elongation factor Elf1
MNHPGAQRAIYCSFCGKSIYETAAMAANHQRKAAICDGCVAESAHVMAIKNASAIGRASNFADALRKIIRGEE